MLMRQCAAIAAMLLCACGSTEVAPLSEAKQEATAPDVRFKALTLYYNARIFTANDAQPWAEAMLTLDGHILAVGGRWDLARGAVALRLVDLKGKVVLPGFLDGHIHPEPLGRPEWFVNSPEYVSNPAHPQYPYGPTAAETIGYFRDRVAVTPAGTPAFALVSINFWASIGLDPRAALDAVSTTHPLIAVSWGGHGMAVNSAALALGGYVDGQADPYGGRLTRDGTGRLTGFVQELAEVPIFQSLANRLSDAELIGANRAYVSAAHKQGIVRGLGIPFMVTEDRADTVYSAAPNDFWRRACLLTSPSEVCEPFRGEQHVKIFIDGSPDRCETLVSVPYLRPETCPETDANWRGYANLTTMQIDLALTRVSGGQGRLLAHSIGDSAVGLLFDRLEALGGSNACWTNVTLEHGDYISAADVARAKRLCVTIVQNPTHLASVPPLSVARYDGSIVAHSEPLKSLLDAGVNVALASDDFTAPTPTWIQAQIAATHPFRPAESISVTQFVIASTRTAAKARGWDDLGTLEPGKRASFQVLTGDPFTTPIAALPAISSAATVVDGDVAWSDGSVIPATP